MTNTNALPPVYELPAVQEKVLKVRQYIDGKVRARNLYGWRFFVDELKVNMEMEIYKHEELFRQGVHNEYGIGAYCNMALQGALNFAAMCATNKRKINFEATSLDALVETEKGSMSKQIPSRDSEDASRVELLVSIQQEFGTRIQELAEKVMNGEQLDRKELAELRKSTKNPKMRNLLTEIF